MNSGFKTKITDRQLWTKTFKRKLNINSLFLITRKRNFTYQNLKNYEKINVYRFPSLAEGIII
jgi:hypothetical protein